MATSNRATLLNKTHKVLKKQYKVVPPAADRSIFEHLIFACCLENAHYEKAEEAFAAVQEAFFDWNEMRVSTIKELEEVLHMLPEPTAAGQRVKRVLQSVFESTYSFELEGLQKQNLGQAQQRLKRLEGTTPFTIAYVTQAALNGHAVPVDRGALEALCVIGVIDEAERDAGNVPGLERAIPKSKGLEFGSLLHQLSADFIANPYAPALHKLLLQIAPDAKERLPKKLTKKQQAAAEAKKAEEEKRIRIAKRRARAAAAEGAAASAKKKATANKKTPAKKGGEKPKRKTKVASASVTKKKPR